MKLLKTLIVMLAVVLALGGCAKKPKYHEAETGNTAKSSKDGSADAEEKKDAGNNVKEFTVDDVTIVMVAVEGGTFMMGATEEQLEKADTDEHPAPEVELTSFYIGQTEVTQELWEAVMGSNPSYNKGDKLPVEQVNWFECKEFIAKLNEKTGAHFRLPTEAEWEFAAHGGNKSQSFMFSGSNISGDVAWDADNSGEQTHAVATKRPNELGIYDMTCNVWEWCHDWYNEDYYKSSPSTNPQGPGSGQERVNRGGGYVNSGKYCRVSYRDSDKPSESNQYLGLRLAL